MYRLDTLQEPRVTLPFMAGKRSSEIGLGSISPADLSIIPPLPKPAPAVSRDSHGTSIKTSTILNQPFEKWGY